MLRTLTALTALLSICTALAAATPGAAAAATSSAQLSAAEYTQLGDAFTALDQALSSKNVSWSKADAACRKVGTSTPLLTRERASCLDAIATYRVLFKFNTDQVKCEAKDKAKSGSSANDLQLVQCLNSDYQSLARVALNLYTTDAATNKQLQTRGFTGKCFDALGESTSSLKDEEDFATSAKQLAADVTVMVRIKNGKAPATAIKESKVNGDVKVFETAAKKVLNGGSSGKISDCAHA